jgi:uncharacterized NAD-dependent epimerase/dehydratase family protein
VLSDIRKPYLLFLGDVKEEAFAKTAFGLADWCPDDCVAQWNLPDVGVRLPLPEMSPREAAAAGAKSMVVAVAPIGGDIPPHWRHSLVMALESGLDLVSGLHVRLAEIPEVRDAAARCGRALHDVRHPRRRFSVATGRRRTGKRLLTVGTDCAVGKKYAALAIATEMRARGKAANFRATGQTGIMIAGEGIAIDAVVADFISGAAEALSPDNDHAHWDIIEGQGSLFHPAYAGVTLGLIHGSQADALVLCHDGARRFINGFADYPIVSVETAIPRLLDVARLTNPAARFVGVCLNSSKLPPHERIAVMAEIEERTELPCCDPILDGVARIVDLLGA